MEQTMDIQNEITYSVADTGLDKSGLFARVSDGNLFRKVSEGYKNLVTHFVHNDF